MEYCLNGFTKQEDCTMCDCCISYGYTDCVKGFTEQEDCDMCGVCR